MGERITISFEMEKEDIFAMYLQGSASEEFDKFLKETFSSFFHIHAQNIKHNLEVAKQEMEEKEIEKVTLNYLKASIAKQDMEDLQIAAFKEMFKEGFINKKEPNEAVRDSLQTISVMIIAEKIKADLRSRYLFSKVS